MSSHNATALSGSVTTKDLARWKRKGRAISAVTCYDYTMALLVDRAQVDVVLVGDSLGNVVQGLDTTLPVTVDDIIYHARATRRGLVRAHLVGDMPFLSYQVSVEEAMRNAGRLMKEGGVHAVKLEGGREIAETVRRMVAAGIPVMGHVGLTPQSVHQLGGFRVQGRTEESARRILEDAQILQEAGVYALVLECVPERLAKDVTAALDVPTIGIGAGRYCDGQILVLHDLLGLNTDFRPKFVRRFAHLSENVLEALKTYVEDVHSGSFPNADETFEPQPSLAVV